MADLGELKSTHRGAPGKNLFAAVIAGAITIFVVWAIFEMKPESTGVAWLIALGGVAITAYLGWQAKLDGATRIEVRDHGFLVYRGEEVTTSLRYDQIAGASTWNVNGKVASLNLKLRTGHEARVQANVENWDDVQDAIVAGMSQAPAELPTARVL